MELTEKELTIPKDALFPFAKLGTYIHSKIRDTEIPIRFAVTAMNGNCNCELGVLSSGNKHTQRSIFSFRKRWYENQETFNTVMIVPTGIGAEIGGHAGDACPAARLLAAVSDTLITHPNVVNASDINELPANGLYVEGSVIADLLMGNCGLQLVRSNRVLILIDAHKNRDILASTINAVSAARASFGMDCVAVVEVDPPIVMKASFSGSGSAVGSVRGLDRLCQILDAYTDKYDAVALASVIKIPFELHTEYFAKAGEIVNPWGGVEAMLTHAITKLYSVPTAHAPMEETTEIATIELGIVDPRMAAEAISESFLHCVLKGLHESPRLVLDHELFGFPGIMTVEDMSCLVIPDGCIGLPTLAAIEQGIPVIAVRENRNRMKNELKHLPFSPGGLITVENYLEAAGVIAAMRAGVALSSVRRPLAHTKVMRQLKGDSNG